MKIFSSFLCLLLPVIFMACAKEVDPPPPEPTKTDHLTASVWKVEDMGTDQNRDGVIEQSILGLYTCIKDNTITFKKDNTGTTDDGVDKCNPSTPATAPISWNFSDSETSLVVNNSSFVEINGKSKILQLNNNSLVLNRDSLFMGSLVSFSVRLKH